MPLPQIIEPQRDFSAGETDSDMKVRDDLPVMRAAARQMPDWRILNSGQIEQRPGRKALFAQTGRVDEIEVSPGVIYRLCFGTDGSLTIRDSSGASVETSAGHAWTTNVDQIVWTQVKVSPTQTDAVICFPSMRTLVASYNGASWSIGNFSFSNGADGIRGAAFYRLVQPGATMGPSGAGDAGISITILTSAAVFKTDGSHVGVLFRFANSRMQITAVTDAQTATATLLETMNPTQRLTIAARTGATVAPKFLIGQEVTGSITGVSAIVVGVDYGAGTVDVQVLDGQGGFSTADVLVGPATSASISGIASIPPAACTIWDEEIISDARGWPESCFTDRGRLGFCNIPGLPDAIAWSATGLPYYFAIGSNATDAMVEILAGKPHIYHVGAWFDEIVFTSKGLWYIPIGSTNTALQPGSVEFRPITNEASSSIRPAFTTEGFLYVNAGLNTVKALFGTGAAYSTRPYLTTDVARYHKHLFAAQPKAITISTGDGQFPERYVYVLNADNTLVVGRYEPGKEWLGWLPWKGEGVYSWVSALYGTVLVTVAYGGQSVTEKLDDTVYLDCAQAISGANTAPWLAVGSVNVMDGVRDLGSHLINASGAIVPNYPGEDLSSPTIVAGFAYSPLVEPFAPNVGAGADQKQRTRRRRVARVNVSVQNSTGFFFARLYSGPVGASLPASGAVLGGRRVPAYNQGDDQSQAPPLREQKYAFRGPVGHSYDPRYAIIKDTPGPLRIGEISSEVST